MMPPLHRERNGSRRRCGAAALEFALIAPMLVFMFLGMIEVTRGLQVQHTLSDAVRTAGRLAIQSGYDNASVKTAGNSVLKNNGIDPAHATWEFKVNGTTADVKTAVSYDKVSVRIEVPAEKVGWISPLFLAGKKIEAGPLHMMRQN